jgi:hypothetical protein
MAMAANWHPLMGFEVLTLRLFCCVTFASLSGHPITNKDRINIGIHALNHTGLFPKEYKMWILHGNDASKMNDFVFFKTFCENAVQTAALTAIPGSQHGYGTAVTDDDALAHLLMDAVSTFGTAYAATYESLRSNATNILAIQGQLQIHCQAVGTGQPSQQQPQRPWNRCVHNQQHGGNNGGGNGGSNGGGGGYNSGGGGYSRGGSGGNANSSVYSGCGGGNGGNYGVAYGGGNRGNQTPSNLHSLPVKWYKNWN